MEEQEASRASAAAPLRQPQETEEEEELPLLFMEGLPSNFQQSAQLAAIATFMAASDDEDEDDHTEPQCLAAPDGRETDRSSGRQRRLERSRRRRQPYAKPVHRERKTEEGDTKELQLFLSLFHV